MVDIKKAVGSLNLDGFLDENQWTDAAEICDFTVSYPNFGQYSAFTSYVRVFYDEQALYVGGFLFDPVPDSVSYTLSQRDDYGNGDWFRVTIDPYATNVTAFSFALTAAGVELDAIEYVSGSDYTWNAVWKSATVAQAEGWSFEMRIPFSAIRFPKSDIHEWNVNFTRQIRRIREESSWHPINPAIYGTITQSGKLSGMDSLKAPMRLSFTPYLSAYLENAYDEEAKETTWKRRIMGGMDMKYGLNDAFTLDMTLIPDFGQTVSDKHILNLGPFEVLYDENRPFFLEAMDLFRIGGIFYSRRVGGTPFKYNAAYDELIEENGEEVEKNPALSPLINAVKLSGRTKKGLGIGVFNALEGRTYASISDSAGNQRRIETNPLTNYNVFVLSQNLRKNSSISLVNTHVLRDAGARDANVAALVASLYSNDNSHQIDMNLRLSSLFEQGLWNHGHAFSSSISKVSGTFGYTMAYSEMSETFNPNDLGFLYANNNRAYTLKTRFNDYTSGTYFLRRWFNATLAYTELYKPQLFSDLELSWSAAGTTRKFLTFGFNGAFNPLGSVNHFESRVAGKAVAYSQAYEVGAFYSSDYSKVFALDLRGTFRDFTKEEQLYYSLLLSPRLRASDRLFFVWTTQSEWYASDYGYVRVLDEQFEEQIVLGVRDRSIIENTLRLEFIFTNRMSADLRFRHYWQKVKYTSFRELGSELELIESSYKPEDETGNSLHNTSYNAFTIDLNYRWVFWPGSEFRIVYKNNIFHSKGTLDRSYFDTFDSLFDQPQVNSISVKVLFFIDSIYFRNKQKKRVD